MYISQNTKILYIHFRLKIYVILLKGWFRHSQFSLKEHCKPKLDHLLIVLIFYKNIKLFAKKF